MKKLFLCFVLGTLVIGSVASCSVKRDCQGVKHYKQKGGFYM